MEPYTFNQFGLPPSAVFAAAAVDPGKQADPWAEALNAAKKALAVAKEKGMSLRLVVFPSNYFERPTPGGIAGLRTFATENNVDLVVQFVADDQPQSLMIASNGENYSYSRTHRLRQEKIRDDKLASHYWVVDRHYARVALLHDVDLMAPETSLIMEKLGVDVVALNADTAVPIAGAIWASRTADYYNIVVANRQGKEGIYLGGYPPGPQAVEDEGLVLTQIDTRFVRSKKVPRFLDFKRLLDPCGATNC